MDESWKIELFGGLRVLTGDRALTRFREVGDPVIEAFSLRSLGVLARHAGNLTEARRLHEQATRLKVSLGVKREIANAIEAFAAIYARQGAAKRAGRLLGAGEALREALGSPVPPCDRAEYDELVAAVRQALSAAEFADAWATGRAMSVEQAVVCALED